MRRAQGPERVPRLQIKTEVRAGSEALRSVLQLKPEGLIVGRLRSGSGVITSVPGCGETSGTGWEACVGPGGGGKMEG